MKSIGDVFRWAALPQNDRDLFLRAARVLLELDPKTKDEHAALLRSDLEDPENQVRLMASLESAAEAVLREAKDENWFEGEPGLKDARERTRRILAAWLVTKGFRSGPGAEYELNKAAHLLRDIRDDAANESVRDNGSRGGALSAAKKRPKLNAKIGDVKAAAKDARDKKRVSDKSSQEQIARHLLKKKTVAAHFKSRKDGAAPSPKALVEFARRNRFKL